MKPLDIHIKIGGEEHEEKGEKPKKRDNKISDDFFARVKKQKSFLGKK